MIIIIQQYRAITHRPAAFVIVNDLTLSFIILILTGKKKL